ncbi:hypothetical protein CVT25_009576 [Psilocybe cyanescens]|uniref:Uncharacterized protein n=1 Tax=Psilocybe cyanescens TaxID=93625 RepID=A0A409XVJ0_PSICY|nr:hypothetical protein CVT25_009576 [Psilocybe cyanescens]
MASQKEILGRYLYKLFCGENTSDPPKGIRKDYEIDLPRGPSHWSDILMISTIVPSNQYLQQGPIITRDSFFVSIEKEDLSPLLVLLVDERIIKDPDAPAAPSVGTDIKWMEKAWKTEYCGNHHQNLLKNISHCIGTGPYENTAAIIQSSGFGKSRTVDEMATLVATIPMNIRDAAESNQGAYPPPDVTLTKIFRSMNSKDQDINGAVHAFHRFFTILFRQFAKKIDSLPQSGDSLPVRLRNDLANPESRLLFYNTVCNEFDTEVYVTKNLNDAQNLARAALHHLVEKIPRAKGSNVSLILYIDEAHTLANFKIGITDSTLYDAMVKAAADYKQYRFFILFLSTSSQLRRTASPMIFTRSPHMIPDRLVAPFTEMPFDCHPQLQDHGIKPGLVLGDIQEYSFITYFGRPLWWTFTQNGGDESKVRQLATAKLTGLSPAPSSYGPFSFMARLAVLDTLLNLEYRPMNTQTQTLVDDMVAGHMRTAFSMPTDRTSMYSGYPSEPVLAEAALDTIHSITNSDCPEPMAELFTSLDKNTMEAVDVEQRGENVAKMILLRAYMAAVKEESPNPDQYYHPWRNGCSLITFLRHLTAEAFYDIVMKSRPDTEVGGQCLEEAFKNAWVRFTHFSKGTDDSSMTTSMACIAFIRGMAVIGWPSQDSVDLHIPVLLDKTKPITEGNMSGILVQVKLGKSWSEHFAVAVNADNLGYFPRPDGPRESCTDEAYRSRPYISLVMELGKTVQEEHQRSLVVNDIDNGKNIQVEAPLSKKHHPRTSHPRYSLFFYGRSHRVYRCIPHDGVTLSLYNRLLDIYANASFMFYTYPQDRDAKYVQQMKPFWTMGADCSHWVDDKMLNGPWPTCLAAGEIEEVLIGGNTLMDIAQPEGSCNDVTNVING